MRNLSLQRVYLILLDMLPYCETNQNYIFTGFDKYLNTRQLEYIKAHLRNNNVITLAKASHCMTAQAAEWKINRNAFMKMFTELEKLHLDNPPEIVYKFIGDNTTKDISCALKINSKYRKMYKFDKISSVEKAVYRQYPWLKNYQSKLKYLNKKQPELPQNRMNINVKHDNGYLQKISVRYSNNKVSLKANNGATERHEFCYRNGLNYSFDIKSSIHKITYLMNTGIWLPQSTDMYEMYHKEAIKNGVWNKTIRQLVKDFMQRCYFDKSKKTAVKHCKDEYLKQHYKCYDDAKVYSNMCGLLYDAMRKVLGKTYDSEVFLHESCIMIDVMWELIVHRGCKVFPVYDALYFDKEQNDIEQIVEKCALKYYKMVKKCTSPSYTQYSYGTINYPVSTISSITTISNNCISIDSRKHSALLKRSKSECGAMKKGVKHSCESKYINELKKYGLINITNDDEFRAKAYAAGLQKSKVCRLLKYKKENEK